MNRALRIILPRQLLVTALCLLPSICLAWSGKVVGIIDGDTITVLPSAGEDPPLGNRLPREGARLRDQGQASGLHRGLCQGGGDRAGDYRPLWPDRGLRSGGKYPGQGGKGGRWFLECMSHLPSFLSARAIARFMLDLLTL